MVANVLGFHQTTAKDTLMRFVFFIGVFVHKSYYFCILHWYFCICKLSICICTCIIFTLVEYWSVIATVLDFHHCKGHFDEVCIHIIFKFRIMYLSICIFVFALIVYWSVIAFLPTSFRGIVAKDFLMGWRQCIVG